MLKSLMALCLVLGFVPSAFAVTYDQGYECIENCDGDVGVGGTYTGDDSYEDEGEYDENGCISSDDDCNHDHPERHRRHRRHHRTQPLPPAYPHPVHQPMVTCYTRNNYGMQFYGTSYNVPWAQNIAFNVCYNNSWYPASCFSVGCYWQ